MRKSYRFLATLSLVAFFSIAAKAQNVTVSGTVVNETTAEKVPAVSVLVKGTSQGTFTNAKGEFNLQVTKVPVVLVFSSIGYEEQELTVSSASPVNVSLKVNNTLGQEVVVASTRTSQRILESPVTVERMSNAVIKNVPAPTVYEAITNLKGVDVHTASLTFRTVTTRGFVSSGNTRLNQLVDGMDNQAPGLNFSVSSIVGLTDLDIDNIEVLSGASSALYGSGGMNGTVLITGKNPFKYQGFSYNIKQGIMHTDGKQRSPAPYNNISMRWAKVINNKIAFRISGELLRGSDWQAQDYDNKAQIGILSQIIPGSRSTDPNYNGVNTYGDETSINLTQLSALLSSTINSTVLSQSGGLVNLQAQAQGYFETLLGSPAYPSNAQVNAFISAFAPYGAALQQAAQLYTPLYLGLTRNYFGTSTNVTRTGYEERNLVDYNTLNAKLNAGFHWKINDKMEASFNSYFGTGTTVYTGANRYSLRNFKMAQHKVELKAANWFVRGYTTQENAGDSYIGDALGSFINEAWKPSVNTSGLPGLATSWFPQYILAFSEGKRMSAGTIPDINLHNNARTIADVGRYLPGTPGFINAANTIKNKGVNQAGGSKFLDRSELFSTEAQVNISDAAGFSDAIEIIAGASWKQWVLNSKGTIFADTTSRIRINEYGGYVQLKKKLLNDVLTLTASGRYDNQTNYDGKFTPRVTATVQVARDNYIRASYQTAYRFPTNQNQYISLRIGGGNSYLIGCLPEFQTYYGLNGSRPGYTAASVVNYRSGSITDSSKLQRASYNDVVPETVKSYELGYKGIIKKKVLVDAYFYYSSYKNFLVNEAVVQSLTGTQAGFYNPFTTLNLSYTQNSNNTVKALGWGLGLEYQVVKKYVLYGNIFSDELRDVDPNVVTFFNAPKYRFNLGLRNENVCHNFGFNVVYKWQDKNYYEGTFVSGTLPAFGWLDAQVSYRPEGTKSTFRIGGTNVANKYRRTGYGSPAVGGLYYVSYGYNIF